MGSGISGGGNVKQDFWYFGKGRWKWHEIIIFFYFWLIYAQYWYLLNNRVIPCVFLPFFAEDYESYVIYVCRRTPPCLLLVLTNIY